MVGSEIVVFLGEVGYDVIVVEFCDEVGVDVIFEYCKFLMCDFDEYKIKSVMNVKVMSFFEDGVIYFLVDNKEYWIDGFDFVVLVMGLRVYNLLEEVIKKMVFEIYVIGDVICVCWVLDVIKEVLDVVL